MIMKKLQVLPEVRYQRMKQNPSYHQSGWVTRGLDTYDGWGCNNITGCIASCRFYPDKGRIEDDGIVEQFKTMIETRQRIGEFTIYTPPFAPEEEKEPKKKANFNFIRILCAD